MLHLVSRISSLYLILVPVPQFPTHLFLYPSLLQVVVQRILTWGRITVGADFPWRKVKLTPAIRSNAVNCSIVLVSYRFFCCIDRSIMLFSGPNSPQNCPFPLWIWTPSNTWFFWPTGVAHQNGISTVHQFSQGSQTWPTNIQTEDHATSA